jgi:hypothetical protein
MLYEINNSLILTESSYLPFESEIHANNFL